MLLKLMKLCEINNTIIFNIIIGSRQAGTWAGGLNVTAPHFYIKVGEVIGFRLFRATGLAFILNIIAFILNIIYFA